MPWLAAVAAALVAAEVSYGMEKQWKRFLDSTKTVPQSIGDFVVK
jgi:hypothetical protein